MAYWGALSKYLLKRTENHVLMDMYNCPLGFQRQWLLRQDLSWKTWQVFCWYSVFWQDVKLERKIRLEWTNIFKEKKDWEGIKTSNSCIFLFSKELSSQGENIGSSWDATGIILPLLFPLVFRKPVPTWKSNMETRVKRATRWYTLSKILRDDSHAERKHYIMTSK